MSKNILRKTIALLTTGVFALGLGACHSGQTAAPDQQANKLTVGAYVAVSNQILKFVKDHLAREQGIELEIKEYSDYVQPNKALQEGDLDANFFQHSIYLEQQIKERGYDFTHGKGIYLPVLAAYSKKYQSLKQLPKGAKIGLINDPTNQVRAFKLAAQAGLIRLPQAAEKQNVETINSAKEYNPNGYHFEQIEGPQLVNTLPDLDLALIPNNFASEGGLKVTEALVTEQAQDNPYSNVLAWRKNTKKAAAIKKLDQLLHSAQTKAFLEKTWPDRAVIAAF